MHWQLVIFIYADESVKIGSLSVYPEFGSLKYFNKPFIFFRFFSTFGCKIKCINSFTCSTRSFSLFSVSKMAPLTSFTCLFILRTLQYFFFPFLYHRFYRPHNSLYRFVFFFYLTVFYCLRNVNRILQTRTETLKWPTVKRQCPKTLRAQLCYVHLVNSD